MMNHLNIKHDPSNHIFYTQLKNGRAILDYEPHGDKYVDFKSTYVPKDLRRRGIGSTLAEHALDYAKMNHLKVKPTCPFVRDVMNSDPVYRRLAYEKV